MAKRSKTELSDALKNQLGFLKRSCDAYDSGHKEESLRIATIVHLLVHDKGRTVSLLGQIGAKERTKFYSSGHEYNPKNILAQTPLVMMRFTNTGVTFVPILGGGPHPPQEIPFSRWWEQTIITDKNHQHLSRKNLIFMLRDKDGGAHFDESISEHYQQIKSGDALGWTASVNGESAPIPDLHYATVRQIGFEVIQTIEKLKILDTPASSIA